MAVVGIGGKGSEGTRWPRRDAALPQAHSAVLRDPYFFNASAHIGPSRLEPLSAAPYFGAMSISRFDHWLGRTLFVPPIIKLCQLTRQTQFAVSRLFWFIAALDAFYRADNLFSSILWGGMSLLMMFTATQRADLPTASFMAFRMLALVFLALDLARGAVSGIWAGSEFWLLILIAEYAATIRTVPPRESAKAAARDRSGGIA